MAIFGGSTGEKPRDVREGLGRSTHFNRLELDMLVAVKLCVRAGRRTDYAPLHIDGQQVGHVVGRVALIDRKERFFDITTPGDHPTVHRYPADTLRGSDITSGYRAFVLATPAEVHQQDDVDRYLSQRRAEAA